MLNKRQKRKKLTILDIIQSKSLSSVKKKLFWEKWKFNQLPQEYRKSYKQEYREKFLKIS